MRMCDSQRSHVCDEIGELRFAQLRSVTVTIAAAAGAETISQCRRTAVVHEGRMQCDADERRHLERAARADIDSGVVGEMVATVATRTTDCGACEQLTSTFDG